MHGGRAHHGRPIRPGRAGQGLLLLVGDTSEYSDEIKACLSLCGSLVSAGAAPARGRGLSRTRVWYGSPPVADFVKHATRAANNSADHIGVWHACHRARSHIIPIIHRLGLYSAAHDPCHACLSLLYLGRDRDIYHVFLSMCH